MQMQLLLDRRQCKAREVKHLEHRCFGDRGVSGLAWLVSKASFLNHLVHYVSAWAKPGGYSNKTLPVSALVKLPL